MSLNDLTKLLRTANQYTLAEALDEIGNRLSVLEADHSAANGEGAAAEVKTRGQVAAEGISIDIHQPVRSPAVWVSLLRGDIAEVIDAERRAERIRCADVLNNRDYHVGPESKGYVLNAAASAIRALPD